MISDKPIKNQSFTTGSLADKILWALRALINTLTSFIPEMEYFLWKIWKAVLPLKWLRRFSFKWVKRALFTLLKLTVCLVLFRVGLLSNLKIHKSLIFLWLDICILNLLPYEKGFYNKSKIFYFLITYHIPWKNENI